MSTHELKTWPGPFGAIASGVKHHEVRADDRGFASGDDVYLCEWEPSNGYFTGRKLYRRIGYLSRGPDWGLPVGLCVFTLLDPTAASTKGGTMPSCAKCGCDRSGSHDLGLYPDHCVVCRYALGYPGTMPRDWERELAEMRAMVEAGRELLKQCEDDRDEARRQSRHAWERAAEKDKAYGETLKERDAALSRCAELTAELRKSEQDAVTWARAAHPNHIAAVIARAEKAEERLREGKAILEKRALENEALKERLAELEQDKLANDTSFAACQADRAELQAQAAVMREAFDAVIDWQGVTHEDDDCPEDDTCRCPIVVKVNAAFRTDAGRALAERVACLEEVAEAARRIPPYLNPRLNGALYRLDALRGGAK